MKKTFQWTHPITGLWYEWTAIIGEPEESKLTGNRNLLVYDNERNIVATHQLSNSMAHLLTGFLLAQHVNGFGEFKYEGIVYHQPSTKNPEGEDKVQRLPDVASALRGPLDDKKGRMGDLFRARPGDGYDWYLKKKLMQHIVIDTNQPPQDANKSSTNIPFYVPFIEDPLLFGREQDLSRLREELQSEGPLAIHGQAGVGKTQLAVKYVHHAREAFNQGVFWIDANDPQTIMNQFQDFAEQLHIPDTGGVGHDWARRRAMHFIGWLRKKRHVLLVLDNLDDDSWILHPLPGLRHTRLLSITPHLLVTTQLERVPGINRHLFLDRLDGPSSVSLLLHESEKQHERMVNVVSAQLGGIPLALRIAGTLVREEHLTFSDLSKILRDGGISATFSDLKSPDDYRPNQDQRIMDLMIGTSWNLLTQHNPLSSHLLLDIAGMPLNRKIRREWLIWTVPPEHIGLSEDQNPWDLEYQRCLERNLTTIFQRSLLEHLGPNVRLHPLIYDYLNGIRNESMLSEIPLRAAKTLRGSHYYQDISVSNWRNLRNDLPMIIPLANHKKVESDLKSLLRCLELQRTALSQDWDIHNQIHLQALRLGDDHLARNVIATHPQQSLRLNQVWSTETVDPALSQHLAFNTDSLIRDVSQSHNGRVVALIRIRNTDELEALRSKETEIQENVIELYPEKGYEWELASDEINENPVRCSLNEKGSQLVSLSQNGMLTLWDCETGLPIIQVRPPEEIQEKGIQGFLVYSLGLHPQGRFAVVAISNANEPSATIWSCDLEKETISKVQHHNEVITECVIDVKGTTLCFTDRAGRIFLKKSFSENFCSVTSKLRGKDGFAQNLSFDPKEGFGFVRVTNKLLVKFSTESGEKMDDWELPGDPLSCTVQDHHALVGYADGDCHLISLETCFSKYSIVDTDGAVTGCWFAATTQKAITQTDASVKLWDLNHAQTEWEGEESFPEIVDCSYNQEDGNVHAIDLYGNHLRIDKEAGTILGKTSFWNDDLSSVQTSREGGHLMAFHAKGKKVKITFYKLSHRKSKPIKTLSLPSSLDQPYFKERLEFGKEGFFVSIDHSQLFWFDALTFKEKAHLDFHESQLIHFTVAMNKPIGAYCTSPKNHSKPSSSQEIEIILDHLNVWNIQDAHENPTFDPDENFELCLWCPTSGILKQCNLPAKDAPSGLLLTPDGTSLIIGTHLGRLLLWEPSHHETPVPIMQGEMDFVPLDVSNDGRLILVSEGSSRISVFDMTHSKVISKVLLSGIHSGRFIDPDTVILAGRGGISCFTVTS